MQICRSDGARRFRILSLGVWLVCGLAVSPIFSGTKPGEPFQYNIPVLDIDSQETTLEYYRGKTLLVFYFSPTCGHCKHFFPRIAELGRRMGKGLYLVGVSSGSVDWSGFQDFARQHTEMRILYDAKEVLGRTYGGEKVPNPLLIGAGGTVLYWYDGINETEMIRLEQALRTALKLKPLPQALESRYYGSLACKACHEQLYWDWRLTAHGHAYRTLQNRYAEKGVAAVEPECEKCHTVGWRQPGGFETGKNTEETVQNAGCEDCHGKGCGWRNKSPVTEATCRACHTPKWSPRFNFPEALPLVSHPHRSEPAETLEAQVKAKGL